MTYAAKTEGVSALRKQTRLSPDELRQTGLALWGAHWKSELADRLGVAPLTIRRWTCGEHPPPRNLSVKLHKMCVARKRELDLVIIQLNSHNIQRVDFGRPRV
jgi:transcriptional regulator with XRE-family HTH domain